MSENKKIGHIVIDNSPRFIPAGQQIRFVQRRLVIRIYGLPSDHKLLTHIRKDCIQGEKRIEADFLTTYRTRFYIVNTGPYAEKADYFGIT